MTKNVTIDISVPIDLNKKNNLKINRIKWQAFMAFEVYGVKVGIRSNNEKFIENLTKGLPELIPVKITSIDFENAEHVFNVYFSKRSKKKNALYKNEELLFTDNFDENDLGMIESHIRITIAEFAEDLVFLHAGVIEYKGKALIIPGRSFSGKTTLVAEFAKRGFEYYSDEYAIIDKDGLVHAFPKKLSMRGIIDDFTQLEMDVEEFGGKKGNKKLEVGIILISKYKKSARFVIEELSAGSGMIESIANSVSIRQNPEFVLKILSSVTNQARIFKTKRPEADKFLDKFIPYLENLQL